MTFWLAPSVLIDFVAAPAIFRNVSSLQEAGTLGMVIFKSFNSLELGLSLIILLIGALLVNEKKLKKAWLGFFVLMVFFAAFFRFHVSPTIVEVNTQRWELSEESEEYKSLLSTHNFYHGLYVKMEGTKVIFLLGAIILVLRRKEEEVI
ncbi:MAG: uncharacterized membrane protein YozB (DUF420 family) [Bacteriovoracaceae bacterium]|jgi:uncharacterized membrane protein YozB (DUF420 family)